MSFESPGTTAQTRLMLVRGLSAFGALVTGMFVRSGVLGYPTLHTYVALAAIPSPVLFVIATIWPDRIWKRKWLKGYLIACAAAPGLCFVALCLWLSHSTRSTSCVYELPEGYTGWAVVEFAHAGASPLPVKEGKLILHFGEDGSLVTSTKMEAGRATDEYYYAGTARQKLSRTMWGGGGLIWAGATGEIHKGDGRYISYENFFVGTEAAYRASKVVARTPE